MMISSTKVEGVLYPDNVEQSKYKSVSCFRC